MNLDLLVVFRNYIESLGLYAKSYIGNLEYDESISIQALPGGVKTLFYDGTRDQTYNVQVAAKSKNQLNCLNSLDTILGSLTTVTDLPSMNGSYQLVDVNIESPPTFVGQDEQGYFIYQLSCTVRMLIKKGAI